MRKGKMMKKIKKLGITALAAVLVVSAAGCGKKEEKVYKNSDIVMSVKDKKGGSLQLHERSVKPG